MLTIDHLRLRLPEAFAPRAAGIARLVADELKGYSFRQRVRINALHLPLVCVSDHESDHAVARQVARAIVREIQGRSG